MNVPLSRLHWMLSLPSFWSPPFKWNCYFFAISQIALYKSHKCVRKEVLQFVSLFLVSEAWGQTLVMYLHTHCISITMYVMNKEVSDELLLFLTFRRSKKYLREKGEIVFGKLLLLSSASCPCFQNQTSVSSSSRRNFRSFYRLFLFYSSVGPNFCYLCRLEI